MKRSWLVWIGLGFIVIVAGLLIVQTLLAYFSDSNANQLASEIEIQEAVVRQGTLTLSVNGSGEFVSTDETELGFQEIGDLLALNVSVGDQVQHQDVLCTLEAMKMENEILAFAGGVVKEVKVAEGQEVMYGDVLFVIE